MKKTSEQTSSNATPNNQPKQLVELARLEIRRRELLRDLALVNAETYRLNREIQVLGIEIPWLSHGYLPSIPYQLAHFMLEENITLERTVMRVACMKRRQGEVLPARLNCRRLDLAMKGSPRRRQASIAELDRSSVAASHRFDIRSNPRHLPFLAVQR